MNVKEALIDLREGIRSKYPLCCVLQFCIDSLLGKTKNQIYRYVKQLQYAPCSFHMKVYQQTAKTVKQQIVEEANVDLDFEYNP